MFKGSESVNHHSSFIILNLSLRTRGIGERAISAYFAKKQCFVHRDLTRCTFDITLIFFFFRNKHELYTGNCIGGRKNPETGYFSFFARPVSERTPFSIVNSDCYELCSHLGKN